MDASPLIIFSHYWTSGILQGTFFLCQKKERLNHLLTNDDFSLNPCANFASILGHDDFMILLIGII